MNKIDVSQIVDPGILQPFTGPSLNFLQNSTKEMVKLICESLIGDGYSPSVPYAIWGLAFAGTQAVPTDIGAGYIYFNGELYFCGGLSGIVTADLFTITVTNDPVADPLPFTDLVSRNVHNIRRIVVTDSGTAPVFPQFTLASVVYLQSLPWTTFTFVNSWSSLSTSKYRSSKDKVELSGRAQNATLANATLTMTTLPVGFRPPNDINIPVNVENAGTIYTKGMLITSLGVVTVDTTGLANSLIVVHLNGVSFVTS